MEDLLSGQTKTDFKVDSIVTGTIVEKRQDGALVDIGLKAEGFIPYTEFKNWEEVNLNDQIDVYLEELENEQNQPGISLQKAAFIQTWKKITSDFGEGSVIRGKMKKKVKGGILIDLDGVEAFLPGSQIDIGPVKNLDDLIDQEYDFKILKINQERHNIVVSRRELLEESRKDMRAQFLKEMKVGELRKGKVKNITDFGAFIDLGGVDGLLHITDMSWGRITNPKEMLEVGQEIEVMVLDIDFAKERVSLGLKQKSANPWDEVETKYPVGSTVKGHVVNIMPYGAFVEIEQGVEGLIHVSEMSWTKRITKASDVVSAGEEVEAVILEVNKADKKISLGLRQKTRNPWEVLAEKYPPGSHIKGKVRNMTTYGAFVEIENDIDGMIHVSDMSWTRKINHPNEVLKVGEEVEAVILDIDPTQQRISLGLKQTEVDPWANIEQIYKIGDVVKGKVTKVTAFGAFIELSHKIDGLVHISQISRDHVEKVKDKLNLGDEIEAVVIKIDKDERRIGLSIKALEEGFNEESIKAAGEEVSAALKPGEALGDMGTIFGNSLDNLDLKQD
ncbi:MAG: 30S ribosomal protein S1 [Lentisphaeria bacterium]|nr:30S ribosomal protein S1 [Lentisphaeria bacterium]MBR3687932.1 30S ribosomal protein S1 [Lentisphaeria bacterium]